MRFIPVSLLLAGCVAVGISACTAEHVAAIDETSQGVQGEQTQADPNDPFGSCEVVPYEDYDEFECSLDGSDCFGGGSFAPGSDGESWMADVRNYCRHVCEIDSDCPVPNTGDAVPRCPQVGLGNGFCELPCDATTTCPDGFVCAWDRNLLDTNEEDGTLKEDARFVCVQHTVVDPYRPPARYGFDL